MSYLSKSEVMKSIRERTRTIKGKPYVYYDAYLGTDPISGKAVRMQGGDLAGIKDAITKKYRILQQSGEAGGALTARQAWDALQAFRELEANNVTISLHELATRHLEALRNDPARMVERTVGKAYDEFVAGYEEGSLNRKTMESRVGKWAYEFGRERQLSSVKEDEVVSYLENRYPNHKTFNNHLTYLRTFFNWCMAKRRRYLMENPLEETEVKKIIWKRPQYVGPDDAARMFGVLELLERKDLLAYAVVSFFCGIRREEILRGSDDEDAILFDIPNATITVVKVKRFTQGAHPRSFTIPDNALAWMKSFDFLYAWKLIGEKVVEDIEAATGIDLPKNAGRHSFITHHLAAYDNMPLTCQMAGTSPQMVKNNYGGLGNKPDALRYFSITPRTC